LKEIPQRLGSGPTNSRSNWERIESVAVVCGRVSQLFVIDFEQQLGKN
jgi:hypothetical protein